MAAIDLGRLAVTVPDVSAAISQALKEFQGRISKRSQSQIDVCVVQKTYRLVGVLAGVAQSAGGRFDEADVRDLPAGEAAKDQATVDRLAAEGVLIEKREDEVGPYYYFLEDSVPAYMWLLAEQARLADAQAASAGRPAPKSSAPSELKLKLQ